MALLDNVHKALKEAELLGKTGRQLIPSDFKPSVAISAKFANATVELGNTIEVDAAQKEPQVHFVVEDPEHPQQRFLVAMMDPDAKSRDEPIWAPFAHWIQGGYLPTDAGAPIDGKPLLEYMGPAPPEGTGPHRYVVLLYREPVSAELQALDKEDRKNFDIEGFVAKNKLELVGANFFYSESKSED